MYVLRSSSTFALVPAGPGKPPVRQGNLAARQSSRALLAGLCDHHPWRPPDTSRRVDETGNANCQGVDYAMHLLKFVQSTDCFAPIHAVAVALSLSVHVCTVCSISALSRHSVRRVSSTGPSDMTANIPSRCATMQNIKTPNHAFARLRSNNSRPRIAASLGCFFGGVTESKTNTAACSSRLVGPA